MSTALIAASLETLSLGCAVARTLDLFEARQAGAARLEGLRLAAIAASEPCTGMSPCPVAWAAMEAAEGAYEAARAALYGPR